MLQAACNVAPSTVSSCSCVFPERDGSIAARRTELSRVRRLRLDEKRAQQCAENNDEDGEKLRMHVIPCIGCSLIIIRKQNAIQEQMCPEQFGDLTIYMRTRFSDRTCDSGRY